jgi:hypothetical protein
MRRVDFYAKSIILVIQGEKKMVLSIDHITPIVALIAGVLILIMPSLLSYVVAIYLIVVGLIGLNGIYHFVS